MFLQIENKAIAIDHIVCIYFSDGQAYVEFDIQDGDQPMIWVLEGNNYNAFMNWWEHKADVYKAT